MTKIQWVIPIWGLFLDDYSNLKRKGGGKTPALPEECSGFNANPRQLLMLNNNVKDLLSLPAPPPPPQKRL